MIVQLRQTKRDRTRDQILAATQEVLLEEGASALGVRRVAERAGLVHSSFYNYYPDIATLLDGVGDLLAQTHLAAVGPVRDSVDGPAQLFAATTRQTLRIFKNSPEFTRLMFDSGIPVDRLSRGMTRHMRADLRAGVQDGSFKVQDFNSAVTIASGSILALALAQHRRSKRAAEIDALTHELLRMLGVPPARATALAYADIAFAGPPSLPMRWKALGRAAPESPSATSDFLVGG